MKKRWLVILCSFVWGHQNAAPFSVPLLTSLEIDRSGFFEFSKQSVIARTRDGLRFEVLKTGSAGKWGRARLGRETIFGHQRVLRVRGSPKTGFQKWLIAYLEENRFNNRTSHWIRAVIGGDAASGEMKAQFRDLGLFHLCVVSGFHMTLMGFLIGFILEFPMRVGLTAGLIGPKIWLRFQPILHLATLAMMISFGFGVGMGQPTQRALLILALQMWRFYRPRTPLSALVLSAAVGQTILFPIGILSPSNLMSWLAYLVVATFIDGTIRSTLLAQLCLFCITWTLLGIVNIGSIIFNILITPVFPFIFSITLIAMIPGLGVISEGIAAFLEVLDKAHAFSDHVGVLPSGNGPFLNQMRGVMLVMTSVIFLNTCSNMSIKRKKNKEDLL
jgi:hypothetical protein